MPPLSQPEFFIDRSLGKSIAEGIREKGFVVRTMVDVYGEKRAGEIPDQQWLKRAGQNHWIVLMKDKRIRYRTVEKNALIAAEVRAFCLTNGNLRGEEQREWIRSNLDAIVRAAERPGPYIYGIYATRIKRIFP